MNNTLNNDFNFYSKEWKNTEENNHRIYQYFHQKSYEIDFLREHINCVYSKNFGFGEPAFRYFWLLIVNQMPEKFKFLEIGVYKGSVLSLIEKCSNKLKKK